MKRYLFICGCPGSGANAMWRVLSQNESIVLGSEWYAARGARLTRDLFQPGRFFSPEIGVDVSYDINTHPDTKDYVPVAKQRFAGARYVGDKIPYLYRHLSEIAPRFQGATIIFMINDVFDVAAFYNARQTGAEDSNWCSGGVTEAVRDWNEALAALNDIPPGIRVTPVHYQRFFVEGLAHPLCNSLDGVRPESICSALGREILTTRLTRQPRNLTQSQLTEIAETANLKAYRRLLAEHEKVNWGLWPSVARAA